MRPPRPTSLLPWLPLAAALLATACVVRLSAEPPRPSAPLPEGGQAEPISPEAAEPSRRLLPPIPEPTGPAPGPKPSGRAEAVTVADEKSADEASLPPRIRQEIEDLLQLRKSLGSPLEGTLLDDGDSGREFAKLLEEAIRNGRSRPPAAEAAEASEPAAAGPPRSPHSPLPETSGAAASRSLAQAAGDLQRHADDLQRQSLPARAARLRRLAARLRDEAREIRELAARR